MDAERFLDHLRKALPATWDTADDAPKKPGAYSKHIFAALARAAEAARMDYRGHSYKRELLYDGIWLPQNGGSYRLPEVVIEHENGTSEQHFIYDMRKLMMACAPLRVMIGYVPPGKSHMPEERLETIRKAAAAGRWAYPDDCADLALVGPYWMHTPRDYLVLHRPA
ncbi:MAG: hypothetical protein HGA19_18610, partial [Oscillochloris sp.]|nr:hypothetical protein [Oscillochloris sp.]